MNKEEIKERLKQALIKKLNLIWNPNTELWDCAVSVNLHMMNLQKLPLKFGKINGSFICNYNELTSLKGAPHTVANSFTCSFNKLTSLEFGPSHAEDYSCNFNELTNLIGCPSIIKGNFSCYSNRLTTLED